MLSRILVATDASEASDRMLECLHGLRRVGSRKVTLVHVFDVRTVGGLYESLKESLRPRLDAQRQLLEAAGFDVTLETPLGVPFYDINRLTAERSASLIVVGSLGESLIGELLLGSTAHAVLQNATMPVLLIRLAITGGQDGGRRCRLVCEDLFAHILFPTDFSETAERAFLFLEHIVRETGARVTLMHVQDRTRLEPHLLQRLEEFNQIDADRLDRMRARLEDRGAAAVHMDIPYGSPTALILERARTSGLSLIVMGSQGRGFIQEVFMGSVANAVSRLAPLPVLFVPALR
jgi:nucleotide-binding universal stress UspA family protein